MRFQLINDLIKLFSLLFSCYGVFSFRIRANASAPVCFYPRRSVSFIHSHLSFVVSVFYRIFPLFLILPFSPSYLLSWGFQITPISISFHHLKIMKVSDEHSPVPPPLPPFFAPYLSPFPSHRYLSYFIFSLLLYQFHDCAHLMGSSRCYICWVSSLFAPVRWEWCYLGITMSESVGLTVEAIIIPPLLRLNRASVCQIVEITIEMRPGRTIIEIRNLKLSFYDGSSERQAVAQLMKRKNLKYFLRNQLNYIRPPLGSYLLHIYNIWNWNRKKIFFIISPYTICVWAAKWMNGNEIGTLLTLSHCYTDPPLLTFHLLQHGTKI